MRSSVLSLCTLAALTSPVLGQLMNPGFETGAPVVGPPLFTVGQWNFDQCAFVGAQQGITPAAGNQMLHFRQTSPWTASGLLACDVINVVDVTGGPWNTMIAGGNAQASASILVNRVPQNATGTVDTAFALIVWAHATLNAARTLQNPIAQMSASLVNSDNNPATWESIGLTLNLPVNTSYLTFRVAAVENVLNNTSGVEFDGHYADDARLVITPAPGALALLGMGGLALGRRRRA